jgi:hypothetical protein
LQQSILIGPSQKNETLRNPPKCFYHEARSIMNISIISKTITTTIGEITIGRKKHQFIHPPMNFKTFYMGVMVVTWWENGKKKVVWKWWEQVFVKFCGRVVVVLMHIAQMKLMQ